MSESRFAWEMAVFVISINALFIFSVLPVFPQTCVGCGQAYTAHVNILEIFLGCPSMMTGFDFGRTAIVIWTFFVVLFVFFELKAVLGAIHEWYKNKPQKAG